MDLGNSQPSPQPHLRQAFQETTPPTFARAAGHPNTLKALSAIERRAALVRQRAIAHHKAFQDRWTAKEAIRIWERHLKEREKIPSPPGVKQSTAPEEVLKMAEHNVRARGLQRLSRIKAIKTRMGNVVIRNFDTPRLKQDFQRAAQDGQDGAQTNPKMRRTR